jgi:hypothetical protein
MIAGFADDATVDRPTAGVCPWQIADSAPY